MAAIDRRQGKPGPYGTWKKHKVRGITIKKQTLTKKGIELLEKWCHDFPTPSKLYASIYPIRYNNLIKNGVSNEEIESAALEGATKAMWHWKPKIGQFSTYVIYWIRQCVERIDVVFDRTKQYRHGVRIVSSVVQHENDELNILNTIGTRDNHDPDIAELKIHINESLRRVPRRYRDIFVQYYGLESGVSMTLEEVADVHGVSRERVRQIVNKATVIIYKDLQWMHHKYILGA